MTIIHPRKLAHYKAIAEYGGSFDQMQDARQKFAAAGIVGPSHCRGEWVMNCLSGTAPHLESITLRLGPAAMAAALADIDKPGIPRHPPPKGQSPCHVKPPSY